MPPQGNQSTGNAGKTIIFTAAESGRLELSAQQTSETEARNQNAPKLTVLIFYTIFLF